MLYIAIGRNVGGYPMDEEYFGLFRNAVVNLIGSPDTVAYGNSSWEDTHEETCVMVWFHGTYLTPEQQESLAVIADDYAQDAIAWMAGSTEFVLRKERDDNE